MNITLLSFQRPLLVAIAPLLLACWVASPVSGAEILYIKPSLEVLMRKNQGDNARIVATVPMGTAVELLQGGKSGRISACRRAWTVGCAAVFSAVLPSYRWPISGQEWELTERSRISKEDFEMWPKKTVD